MASQQSTAPVLCRQQMDALVDGHFRARRPATCRPSSQASPEARSTRWPGGRVARYTATIRLPRSTRAYWSACRSRGSKECAAWSARTASSTSPSCTRLPRVRCLASMAATGRYGSASCMSSNSPTG